MDKIKKIKKLRQDRDFINILIRKTIKPYKMLKISKSFLFFVGAI